MPRKITSGGAQLVLAGSLAMICLAGSSALPADMKPNIILIMADDLGFETLGAYGSKQYRTPNLDRLVQEGMRFDYAYAAPLCTPTRVMLMTGKYNHRNYTQFAQWPKGERCFASMMQATGYATAIVDKWQLGGVTPSETGFDEYCLFSHGQLGTPGSHERYWFPNIGANDKTVETTAADYGPDLFLKYCQDFVRRNQKKPFLLYWAMGIPHAPYDATPDNADKSIRNDIKLYPDMVAYMDKLVGKLVATVDELGLAQNTLIVFTGDNGTPRGVNSELNGRSIRGGKASMSDAGTHAPFLARWKGTVPAGWVCREPVTLCDMYPTFAELAGADLGKEPRLDGLSLLPLLKGEPRLPRDWICMSFKSQWPGANGQHQVSAWVRNQRWKLYDNGEVYDMEKDPAEETPATGAEADTIRQHLQPAFARIDATPEAMKKFRDSNVRSLEKKAQRKGKKSE